MRASINPIKSKSYEERMQRYQYAPSSFWFVGCIIIIFAIWLNHRRCDRNKVNKPAPKKSGYGPSRSSYSSHYNRYHPLRASSANHSDKISKLEVEGVSVNVSDTISILQISVFRVEWERGRRDRLSMELTAAWGITGRFWWNTNISPRDSAMPSMPITSHSSKYRIGWATKKQTNSPKSGMDGSGTFMSRREPLGSSKGITESHSLHSPKRRHTIFGRTWR